MNPLMTTWNCQICGQERPDKKISVLSYPYKEFKTATVNTKYCNDKPLCYKGALKKKEKGEI